MKSVFSNHNQCAHVWAAQSQAEGRSGPLWFEGATIYSYGQHYPIASFVAPDLVLFNDTGSSATTTGKHKPAVSRALYGGAARVIRAPIAPTSPMRDIVASLVAEHATRLETAARSRKYTESNIERADATRADIEYLVGRFGLPLVTLPTFDRAAILARCAAQRAANVAERAERDAKFAASEAERRAKYDAALILWRAGDPASGHLDYYGISLVTALRLSADGTSVETSRGASVPVDAARRLWRCIAAVAAHGSQAMIPNALLVGSFQVREILANGDVIVGCHTLEYSETLALASAQGWAV